ncbi:MAG: hypothetical protein M3503_02370, partial [Actinomycetota bacterium]|nr:hypothetical protein [Actinomycetota bacterium]
MKKRPPLWKRLVRSLVAGAAVAAAMRAVQGRRALQRQVPAVPAPSKEWPPLPDLAAPATSATPAPPPSPADQPLPEMASPPDPTPAASPVSAVVVTPAARVETAVTAPDPAVSSPPADEVDTLTDVAPAPVVRVPGDGPGGAVGTIVTEESPGSDDRLDDRSEDAADQEHLVTDPEPEAVLTDERIDMAREERPLIAAGDDDDVPPAPEPTFGTVPDPEAAAEAPVPVATPVETGPEEELPIPHRAPPSVATGGAPPT